jgi:hypothetical protein
MNWRAGLFRTWVVLSAAWIVTWTAWGFVQWKGAKYLVTDPDGLKFEVTAPAGIPHDEVAAFVRKSDSVKKRQEDCAKEHRPWCDHPLQIEMPNRVDMVSLLLKAVAGPGAALIVGLAGFWIASGFSRSYPKA